MSRTQDYAIKYQKFFRDDLELARYKNRFESNNLGYLWKWSKSVTKIM